MSAGTDTELMAAHATGDHRAFPEILRRHRERMWAVALRVTGDPEDAADALQDACVSAYRAGERFRGEALVGTWLHRIVVNACLDRLRARRPMVPLPEDYPDTSFSSWRDPTGEDATLAVGEALATLPQHQRVPIVLVDVEGYSITEVARWLEVAEGTVKSRCARGRASMARLLGHLRRTRLAAGHGAAAQGAGGETHG